LGVTLAEEPWIGFKQLDILFDVPISLAQEVIQLKLPTPPTRNSRPRKFPNGQ
jgi:hypothetical protein